MNYVKLTLAVAGGIVVGGLVLGAVTVAPSAYREYRRQKLIKSLELPQRDPYQESVQFVRDGVSSVDQAAEYFCSKLPTLNPNPERRKQQIAECLPGARERIRKGSE